MMCAAGISAARAADSEPGCNEIVPQAGSSFTNVTIRPLNTNQQASWQRMGRNIEIKVENEALTVKQKVRVFLCWKIDKKSSQGGKVDFVPSNVVRVEEIEPGKGKGLRIVATIPELGEPFTQTGGPGKNVGIYASNNTHALAKVRTLVYDDKDPQKVIVDDIRDFGVISGNVYCDYPFPSTTAGSGIVEVSDGKNWQPAGGEIHLSVKITQQDKRIPSDALVKVCFRWKLDKGINFGPFHESGPTHILERNPDSLKIAAIVPTLDKQPPRFERWDLEEPDHVKQGHYAIPHVAVPVADVRVILFDSDGFPIADVPTSIGITSPTFAAIIVFVTVVAAFLILWMAGKYRLSQLPKCGPLLRIITTRRGYASLSQFQIILWTFVVIASAAYVMALSGNLIEISTGTLALLGISGSATVIAKAKSEADASAAPPALDPAIAAAAAAAAEEEARKLQVAAALTSGAAKAEADAAAAEAIAYAEAAKAKAVAATAVAAAMKKRAAVAEALPDKKQAAADEAKLAEDDAEQKLKAAAITADKAASVTRLRHPSWSDLVMEEVRGRELDVTRIQMLYFTLVTATFVLLRVLTSYEIPVIPEGFLILMGISNSVYVGSKFAAKPAGK